MKINNQNNTSFGAVKAFPHRAKNPMTAAFRVLDIQPKGDFYVLPDGYGTRIFIFDTLANQKAYTEQLLDIPFLETDHVLTDHISTSIQQDKDSIVQAFVELAKKAGWQ